MIAIRVAGNHSAILPILALLAVAAYLPVFTQPLLEDDYPMIADAQRLGAPSGWAELASNPMLRGRAIGCRGSQSSAWPTGKFDWLPYATRDSVESIRVLCGVLLPPMVLASSPAPSAVNKKAGPL